MNTKQIRPVGLPDRVEDVAGPGGLARLDAILDEFGLESITLDGDGRIVDWRVTQPVQDPEPVPAVLSLKTFHGLYRRGVCS